MVQIANLPFGQLTNLNILGELRIQGVLVVPGGQNIVEVTGNYTQQIDDDIIIVTGPSAFTMIQSSTAIKSFTVKSVLVGGNITLTAFAGDLVNGAATLIITPDTSVTLAPINLDWAII